MVEDHRQIDAIDSFWESSLGCDRGLLAGRGLAVCRKTGPSNREEIFVFKRDETYVVEVQEKSSDGAIYSAVVEALRESPLGALLDGGVWNKLLKLRQYRQWGRLTSDTSTMVNCFLIAKHWRAS